MNRITEFTTYLKSHVGDAYVWGAQGECVSTMKDFASWVKRRETSTKNYNRAMAFIKKADKKPLYAFDCSGLGVYFLLEKGLIKSDTTAAGLYRACKKITREELREGDFVFCHNGAKIHHVGYYIGGGKVIEAMGRDAGVVCRDINASGAKYWNRYGRFEKLHKNAPKGFVFTRNLKYGCIGEDVKELKKLLANVGYGGLTLTNANFYGSTRTVVKQYQKDNGLAADGIAGKKTIAALGGIWNG